MQGLPSLDVSDKGAGRSGIANTVDGVLTHIKGSPLHYLFSHSAEVDTHSAPIIQPRNYYCSLLEINTARFAACTHIMSVFFGQYDKSAQTNGVPAQGQFKPHLAQLNEEEETSMLSSDTDRGAAIQDLARQITQGTQDRQQVDVFASDRSSDLDPSSPDFNPKKWVQGLSQMVYADDKSVDRSLGMSFRNLSVYGYGSDAGRF